MSRTAPGLLDAVQSLGPVARLVPKAGGSSAGAAEASPLKLLLICYECSPYIGSEWAVGWGRLLGAAKVAETHVMTSQANYRHLLRARGEGLIPANVHFHTPEPDAALRRMEKKTGMFAYNYRAYHHWHRLALHYMRALHERERFALVHQVNVCTFREPGYGFELGIPYIWGPMGGSQNFPARFLRSLPVKEALKEGLRGAANRVALTKGRVRHAAKRADLVFAANSTNLRDFQRALRGDVELLLETGLHAVHAPDRTRFAARIAQHKAGMKAAPLRLLWSGELHTRKALPVLLRALALLGPETPWQLDVLGDGPMQQAWCEEARRLHLGDHVRFLGRQTFTDAVAEMDTADLFCFTSLRDTSGNVVLEALAAGVPVICFDHQGCGDMVDDHCGIKIPVSSPRQAYRDWAEAIRALVAQPEQLLALSHGATERASKFLWSHNHQRMNEIYRTLATREAVSTQSSPAAVLAHAGSHAS